jgi:two-component system chemotaxis sensor kinase CheA
MHLLRNTVDHGIEPPDERESLGKSREGLVCLKACYKGNHIFIEVSDDGRGLSIEGIRKKILEKNLVSEADASKFTDDEVIRYIFQPGFSTASNVTELSGRGVGMDVVKTNIEKLKGSIDVMTQPGKGTRFIIKMPLTLAIIQALVIEARGQKFCIPISSVQETINIGVNEVEKVGNKDVVFLREQVIPLVYLGTILEKGGREYNPEKKIPVVIVTTANDQMGLVVDHLYGKQEIVIKTLGDFLERIPNITGATILGDGQVLLILDVSGIINQANRYVSESLLETEGSDRSGQKPDAPIILIVDDSLTIRNIEKNLLKSAGYKVLTAEDGLEAIEMLRYEKVDMVITDVEMPKMNGYSLAREIRADKRLCHLPLIMITTKSQESDKIRGLKAGADVYIGKPFIQTSLLETIAKLLKKREAEA